jgi:endonuclease/exonuclease/phosphatase family metal-dependent hydrolase
MGFRATILILLGAWGFAPAALAGHLRVLTFNAWLLRPLPGLDISRDTDLRAWVMPDHLAATGADVIALQEVWSGSLRRQLIGAMAARGYGFSLYNPYDDGAGSTLLRGAFGDGLLILSKYPLLVPDEWLLRYDGYTRTDEWFVHKGVLHAVVMAPLADPVHLFTSHLGAVSFENDASRFTPGEVAVRDNQIAQLMAWARRVAPSAPVVMALDANVNIFDWSSAHRRWSHSLAHGYQQLAGDMQLPLRDAHLEANHRTPKDEFADPTHTSSRANTYVREDTHFAGSPDCRIDYIFVSAGIRATVTRRVFDHPLTMTPALREYFGTTTAEVFLSDHFGVVADLDVR